MPRAYTGPSLSTWADALTAWRIDPLIIMVIVLAGGCYAAGVFRCQRTAQRWPAARTVFFTVGLSLTGWMTMGFCGVYADVLFWPRAVQTVIVLMVAPLLLALGMPVSLARLTLSSSLVRRLDRLGRSRAARIVTHPAITSALLMGTPFLVYFTGLYLLILHNAIVDDISHVALLGIGFVYFWTRLQVDPVPRSYSSLISLWITLTEVVSDAALGITMMYGNHIIAADYYAALARPFGPTLRSDQSIGGAAIWIIGDLAGLPFLAALFRKMIADDTRQASVIDAELDAAYAVSVEESQSEGESALVPPPEHPAAPQRLRPWWEIDTTLADRYGGRI